ncbi:MAG: hypothetical protein PVG71_12305, partial [Anaerolineae bacterium]
MKTLATEPLHWLAETKFHPPLLREDAIPRPRLLNDLHNALTAHPLTLLSAPAGYGKTTLLAAYCAEGQRSILSPLLPGSPAQVAWLSLGAEDNDPARFLTALITALQRLNPACGATAQTLLTGFSFPPASGGVRGVAGAEAWRVVSVLINDVLQALPDPFALILDDLHHLSEPAIFAALDYLLEHMPRHMHLVVGTRVDPPLALARLRARGQVAELRLADLRFTVEETTAFLDDGLGLDLAPDEVAALHSRTEGWVVGLRLLAGSMGHLPAGADRRTFIGHLAGSDRLIFDFLAEEVLNQQASEIRTFLLKTAILSELTPALCQAVTGRDDAGTLLEEVYWRNLFVVALGGASDQLPVFSKQLSPDTENTDHCPLNTGRWASYRYHDLFAEFLRHRLQQEMPGRVPELHLRAARAESDPTRAVSHYLAASSWHEAVELIEQIGAEMFARGYLDTLSRWINRLPASVRESHPRLLHYLSHCAIWKGTWPEVQSLLERALQGFKAAGDEAAQGGVLADLATCAAAQGDLERSAALHSQALACPIPPHTRVQALLGHALAKGTWGDWAQAERDFKAAMALVWQSSELAPLHLVTFPFFHPGFAFLPGGLEHLERICDQARAQVGDEVSPSRLMVEEMTTVLHLFRGQLAEAIRTGERALALRERLAGHPYLALNAALFLMIAHAARGDYAAVEPLFDVLFLGVDQTGQPPPDLAIYLFYAGRVRWLQSRLQEAREIYAQMCALMEEDPQREFPEARICRTWMRSLLAMAEGRYSEAECALRRPGVLEQKDRASTV